MYYVTLALRIRSTQTLKIAVVGDVGGRPQPGYYLPNDEVGHNEIVIMMSMKMLCYRLLKSGVRM